MKYLACLILVFATQLNAAPKVELPASDIGEVRDCTAKAGKVMVRYTNLFDVGPAVKTIRIENWDSKEQGTFNQRYEAKITLIHQDEIEFGVNKTRLIVTFTSPFICDDMKIKEVVTLGIDKEDPLYKCLHDEEKTAPLQAAEDEAFKVHLDAMVAACASLPYGPEKTKCFGEYNKTSEGKAQMDALSAAQDAMSAYNQACYASAKGQD